MRAADGVLLGVLDDDPTGSQAVHDVQVVIARDDPAADDPAAEYGAYAAALAGPAATCFVLTNTRSLAEPAAAALTGRVARGLMAASGGAARQTARIQLVSRSDSTLRGHLMAEIRTLDAVRREVTGAGFDGVLFVPAFIEAGRLTAADIHWARTGSGLVPVGETEFARDAAFGYTASDLKAFISEKSGGTISPGEVRSISLADIRQGGPDRIRDLLCVLTDGAWVVVNATEYSDLETVAYAVLLAERNGKAFGFRTGPSFVRALAGLEPRPPLHGAELRSSHPGSGANGLIVAGSHVGQTSRQLGVLRERRHITGVELDVPAVLSGTGAGEIVAGAARQVADVLGRSDVLLYTSRTVVSGRSPEESLSAGARSLRRWPASSSRLSRLRARVPAWPGSSPRAASPRTTSRCTASASAAPRWPASCFPA